MSALDHVSLLERLIIAGERAVMQRAASDSDVLADLVQAIRTACNAPCEGQRIFDYHTRMAADAALYSDIAVRRYDEAMASRCARVIGVLLPDLRADMLIAIEQRKRPTP